MKAREKLNLLITHFGFFFLFFMEWPPLFASSSSLFAHFPLLPRKVNLFYLMAAISLIFSSLNFSASSSKCFHCISILKKRKTWLPLSFLPGNESAHCKKRGLQHKWGKRRKRVKAPSLSHLRLDSYAMELPRLTFPLQL